ncbi:MAG: DUF2971 domain-containing protein [Phycisphaerae bacterium]|nr:DUF2971 domain-containing protein [Phycisphaerae bacterium]MDD5381801.1 DUF2971 domain-containing protein [Phycisphaerae bacterium]
MRENESMNLKEYIETPDALFHYTKTSIAIKHILNTKKFKLSILNDMNDPREYKFKLFNSHGTFAPDEESHDILLNEAHDAINRILRFECKVMSFCSNVTPTLILSDGSSEKDKYFYSKGWDRSRMWSQYGENHYGICLILSKEELEKALQTQMEKYKTNYVTYLQEDDSRPSFCMSLLREKGARECAYKYVTDNAGELFFRKNIDYRDEAEFRVVVFDPDKKLECLDISASLKGVIVGDRTDKLYNIHLIKQMCENLKIECLKAHWSTSSPHMLLIKCKLPDST